MISVATYTSNIDVSAISAVDVHVHIEMDDQGHKPMPEVFYEASAKYFKSEDRTPSIDKIAETYRELGMAAVVFTLDARTQFDGHLPNSIDDLVAGAQRNNDVLLPFGSVDPRNGKAAIEEAQRQATFADSNSTLTCRALIHPTVSSTHCGKHSKKSVCPSCRTPDKTVWEQDCPGAQASN